MSEDDKGVIAAQADEAKGIDPSEGPVADPIHEKLADAYDRIERLEDAARAHAIVLRRILFHLDPAGTSHTLDIKDLA